MTPLRQRMIEDMTLRNYRARLPKLLIYACWPWRLIRLEGDEVEFLWKDYANRSQRKTMTLKAVDFIRRFLLHVLPAGFVRVRHYGFLSNRVCQEKLALCRSLMADEAVAAAPEPNAGVETGFDATACPVCGRGRLVTIGTLQPIPVSREGQEGLVLQEAGPVEGQGLIESP